MSLREFVREQVQAIFAALQAGSPPPVGEYDPAALRECLRLQGLHAPPSLRVY